MAQEGGDSKKFFVAQWLLWIVIFFAFAVGLALRIWFLTHQTTTSDNDITGLMAQQILHGHFSAFYWGQNYGGGLEPYLVAVMFVVFGQSSLVLNLTAVLLSGVAAILTWRVALRLHMFQQGAVACAAFVWVFPQVTVWNSTKVTGFREFLIVCGLSAVLICLRMLDAKLGLTEFAALGVVVGLGWWTSPEMAYFLVPAGLLLAGAVVVVSRSHREPWYWFARMGLGTGGLLVGALPWIWANAHSGMASLRASTFQVPPGSPGFLGRLGDFFTASFPMQFNLRQPQSGQWWHGGLATGLVAIVVGLACLGLLFLSGRRGGRNLAFIAGVVLFPFLLSVVPGAWAWEDGRYAVPFVYLLVLALAPGIQELGRLITGIRQPSGAVGSVTIALVVTFCALLFVASLTTIHSFNRFHALVDANATFFSGWTTPDNGSSSTVSALERSGITDAYADYWVAYKLDFLSSNRLHITDIPPDPDRWPSDTRVVSRSAEPAWLFMGVTPAALYQFQNSNLSGPYGWTLTSFTHALDQRRVSYRVLRVGLAVAVIPARRVTPRWLKLPPSESAR